MLAFCLACQPEQPKTDNSKSTDCIIAVTIDTLPANVFSVVGLVAWLLRGAVFAKKRLPLAKQEAFGH